MAKHSVNLVIKKENELPVVKKLRLLLPIFSAVSLFIFVILFLSSIIYINKNNSEYNSLRLQIDNLEKRISANKNAEGIYILTVSRVKTIDQLSNGNKKFISLLSEILKLQSSGVLISQTNIDKKNSVTVSVTASSAASLDEFATKLLNADAAKLFSDIKTSGIVRDKNAGYLLSVSFKPSTSLLE
ncbi:hypothetical protein HY029_00585 [Candidatus Gottesmanbacteria bacterium]|nr:hypothetical protein [Candidatus Gottesmanbacteria bacterium]